MLLPCDFCNSKMAVLFCRADSAKLCLLCDQHVHSANALSLRHVRFKICDTCKIQTATVRCATDNLMLCQHCDWDTHNNNNSPSPSSLHERTPTQGFSGCPSTLELASLLGLDSQGCVVSNCNSSVSSALSEDQSLMYEQIVEMGKRNSGEGEAGVELLGLEPNNDKDDVLVQQQTPFTSLLMLPDDMDVRKNDGTTDGHLPWDSNRTHQVWDFQLGKSRDFGEQKTLRFEGLQSMQDICSFNMNVSTNGVDILSRNEQADKSSSNHEMKKEESKQKSRGGMLSSECKLIESIMKVRVMEDVEGGIEGGSSSLSMSMVPKVSLEEIAKNRGDAMLRYREKKKTRRYDKQIRYESRKARADMRKRVRGRFVKASGTAEIQTQM